MNLAVIPARGGSKRIPRKNIRDFLGKPIIAYSIEAATESGCFDRVIVSTDDQQIAEVAKEYGAEVPFMRPRELADDYATTAAVIKHAAEHFHLVNERPEFICCIYATAPFIATKDLLDGLSSLRSSDANYAFPVTEYPFPIQRAIRITSQGRLAMFNPDEFSTRSQDLEPAYHDAGQFYWGRCQSWLDEKIIFGEQSIPLKIPHYRVQDIDTEEDWVKAEWLYKNMYGAGDS